MVQRWERSPGRGSGTQRQIGDHMTVPVEKAAQLGTEHGTRAAEAWLASGVGVLTAEVRARMKPAPDWNDPATLAVPIAYTDEYAVAFTAAVEATIRTKCEEVGP